MSEISKTFCTLPFLQFSTDVSGYYQPCCIANKTEMNMIDVPPLDFFNSNHMKQLRYDMVHGNESDHYKKACYKCITNEEKTGFSKRLMNRYVEGDVDTNDIESIRGDKDHEIQPKKIDSFKIKIFGNLCNLKCVMCGPFASSSIAAELKKHGEYDGPTRIHPYGQIDKDRFFKDMKELLPITNSIEIVGGEPFMYPETVDFVKWIVDNDLAKNLTIQFITNGMFDNFKLYSYFPEFKLVRILVSIDNVYEKEEYIRYGTIWNQKVENVHELLMIPKVKVRFSNTIQLLNIGYLSDINEVTKKYFDIPASLNNHLTYPEKYRSINIPSDIAEMYLEKYKNADKFPWMENHIQTLKNSFSMRDEYKFLEGMKRLKQLDRMRGNSLPDVFPEFKPYYDKIII